MKTVWAILLLSLAIAVLCGLRAEAQYASQQVLAEELLTQNHRGSFTAAGFAPDGSLYLLLDEGDGVRVLKTDSAGSSVQAQLHLGAAGDSPVALAVDPSGNVYIAGTSTSGALTGTSGVSFPAPADSSENSFVAKLDPQLNLLFLTFVGSGHTAVSSIAATSAGVFVTGSIFASTLPVTSSAMQQ
ncbi:MAG TPA: SBBP repeat-containing protein, partial [Acidobacteriaceae bacterium]